MLLVEDEPDVADMLADALSDRYEVVIAPNGLRALDRLDEEPFDVVVVDMVMPVLDGMSMMRRMSEWGIEVPVVVSSGIPELAAVGGKMGAKAVLVKPYDPEDLVEAIESAMNRVPQA